MTFEELAAIGEKTLAGVDRAPAGLPAPLVYVLLSRQGNLYTVVNDDFRPVIQALGDVQDTVIEKCLTLWKGGCADLPSYAFRTALRRLDPANGTTDLYLKPLAATMVHPKYDLLSLRENPELLDRMVLWFHEKWGIPEEAYRESMEDCLRTASPVPRWYVVMEGDAIVGGLGVIENDFHLRRDLAPNVCAVYVEESCRGQGIAGWMLDHVCREYAAMGVDTLYLATEHTAFYERYGWEFYCLAQEEDSDHMTRMYRRVSRQEVS